MYEAQTHPLGEAYVLEQTGSSGVYEKAVQVSARRTFDQIPEVAEQLHGSDLLEQEEQSHRSTGGSQR
jgi:hypothetical protein